jgi:hypothetical protein
VDGGVGRNRERNRRREQEEVLRRKEEGERVMENKGVDVKDERKADPAEGWSLGQERKE